MIAPTTLLLLRHAEVEARYQRVFGGHIDMDLSPRGQEQAAALAKYLRPLKFDAVYASPMKRVQQTLIPFLRAEERQADSPPEFPKPSVLPGLREVNFGDWTGLGWEEVRRRFSVSPFQWLNLLEKDEIANSESGKVFRARVEPCVQAILRDHPAQSVAVACHGGTIRMILSILLGIPFAQTSMFEIEYASLTRVLVSPHKTEIHLLNFTPWRDLP